MSLQMVNTTTGVLGAAITRTARFYKVSVENAYAVAIGALECSQAAFSVMGSAWQKGLKGVAKEAAASCIGLDELRKANEAMNKKFCIGFDVDGRPMKIACTAPERLGAAVGHVNNAAVKAVATGSALGGCMLYTVGSVRNAMGIPYSNDTLLDAAQMTASGVNLAYRHVGRPMISLAGMAVSSAAKAVGYAAANPTQLASVGVPVAGAAGLLYLAAAEVENANASTSKVAQVFHGTLAAALAASVCYVPGLWPAIAGSY